jgi:thymidine kinase
MDSVQRKSNVGYLELIIGPMFSGKTTHIIQLHKHYSLANMKVLAINYKNDNRYDDVGNITNHNHVKIDSSNVLMLSEVESETIKSADVILINEGQFFKDIYDFTYNAVENLNKIVHICGLDGDFERNVFGDLYKLIPFCDKITKKKSICKLCSDGTHALFSKRMSSSKEQRLIGSGDLYIPVCRSCYKKN